MINDEIIKFINTHLSDEFKRILVDGGEEKVASFKFGKENELRTLRIHLDNSKATGIKALGLNEVILALEFFHEKEINIVNIRNKTHFFKIYSDVSMENYLGCILIKLRKKTDEEIRWGIEVLGIKSAPPDIEGD